VEVPACCPCCDEPFVWELDLHVDRELGWEAPNAPAFLFRCARCQSAVRVRLGWSLERGSDPRPLRLVGGPTQLRAGRPHIVLVHHCPHGCGARVGLELDPDDPGMGGRAWPDQPLILGGYRCPRCDGEGRLRVQVEVSAGSE
jgi:hypothetical protein